MVVNVPDRTPLRISLAADVPVDAPEGTAARRAVAKSGGVERVLGDVEPLAGHVRDRRRPRRTAGSRDEQESPTENRCAVADHRSDGTNRAGRIASGKALYRLGEMPAGPWPPPALLWWSRAIRVSSVGLLISAQGISALRQLLIISCAFLACTI